MPSVISIILNATYRLITKAIIDWKLAVLDLLTKGGSLLRFDKFMLIIIGGLLGMVDKTTIIGCNCHKAVYPWAYPDLKLGHGFVEDWSAIILTALNILMTFKSPKISSFKVIVAGALLGYGLMMIEYDYIAD